MRPAMVNMFPTTDLMNFFLNTAHTLDYSLWRIATKYVGNNFQNMFCSQRKIRPCEHTVIHVFVRCTTTKGTMASVDVATYI